MQEEHGQVAHRDDFAVAEQREQHREQNPPDDAYDDCHRDAREQQLRDRDALGLAEHQPHDEERRHIAQNEKRVEHHERKAVVARRQPYRDVEHGMRRDADRPAHPPEKRRGNQQELIEEQGNPQAVHHITHQQIERAAGKPYAKLRPHPRRKHRPGLRRIRNGIHAYSIA